jgi:RNA ligase
MGILHHDMAGRLRIATRGSFTSVQALHATEVYRDRYAIWWLPGADFTYLFEIIYPGNRIVLDYGDLDDLILLGAVDIETGHIHGPHSPACADWPGPRTSVFNYATLAEALAAPPRPNAEGVVVRYLAGAHGGTMVKLKQDDYVRLHALITKTSTTTIWSALMSGQPVTEQRAMVPDEFLVWVDKVTAELTAAKDALVTEARAAFELTPQGTDRKTFALEASRHPLRSALFLLLDGRPIDEWAWKQVRPDWEPASMISEDAD